MSKNYKYAGLPCIAQDQTDVYETSGQTEIEKPSIEKALANLNVNKMLKQELTQSFYDQVNLANENIETINIKPKDAYSKFKDKYLQSTHFNESQLTYQKYGEWELVDMQSRSEETPYQKYNRLKSEVSELVNQLKCIDESKVNNDFGSNLKPSDILSNLNILENQMNLLKIENKNEHTLFGEETFENIEKKIDEIKRIDEKKEKTEKSDKVTYQLYCNTKLTELNYLTKAQKLEQRIKNLESLIGNDVDQLKKIPSFTNDQSIVEIINNLSSKVAQLDSNHLVQIDSRLTSLLHKFNQLNEKKNEIIDADKQKKINDLYELVDKSNQGLEVVPAILNRLNNLEDLQQQAIHFSEALTYLDTLQSQTQNSLENNEEELKALKEVFSSNIESIKTLLSQMDKRITNLNY